LGKETDEILFFLTSRSTQIIQYFLLQKMTDIQDNILPDTETFINTVCRSIQVSVQKMCEHVTFL